MVYPTNCSCQPQRLLATQHSELHANKEVLCIEICSYSKTTRNKNSLYIIKEVRYSFILFLSSIFPSIRVFSNELALCISWPTYCSFSFGISPSNEYSEFISFRFAWFDLLAVQGTLKSLLQHHSSKALILQHNITVLEVYAPTTNTKIAEVEQFYEGLQIFENQHQKQMSFSSQGIGMQKQEVKKYLK